MEGMPEIQEDTQAMREINTQSKPFLGLFW
jgi:hypothetical protein